MSKITRLTRLTARSVGTVQSAVRQAATRLKTTVSRGALQLSSDGVAADLIVPFDPKPMAAILGERAKLEAQIDATARRGHVPDALVLSYFANLGDEVDEYERRLTEAQHRLQGSLRRLLARCPEPPASEPAPPPKPRRRSYRPISDWLSDGGSRRAN